MRFAENGRIIAEAPIGSVASYTLNSPPGLAFWETQVREVSIV